MALLNCDFFSYELGMNTQLQVLLPEIRHAKRQPEEEPYKIVYCLHGHAQDHTSWTRLGNIETLLAASRVIAVMPNALRSFYSDARHGYRYFSYLTEELPVIMHNHFSASMKREDNFIIGYSMGGYGALKAALTHPDRYAGAGIFSVAADPFKCMESIIKDGMATVPDLMQNMENIFGSHEEFLHSDANPVNLIRKADRDALPLIYHACGTEDFLHSQNRILSEELGKKCAAGAYRYEEWEGVHEWSFWSIALEKALCRFQLI